MPTKTELTLEQSQQGVSDDVLVSIKGIEELKRIVWIKGEKKEALHTTLGRNQSVAEDREFGIRVNRLRGEMIVVYEDKVSFVEELETLSGVIATAKTAVFLKETMDNDDGRVLLLHDLEKQAEERALEKELFVHKLIHDVSC
ncbi:hypothetical protein Tco_1384637 [Tanacetum coccineum]